MALPPAPKKSDQPLSPGDSITHSVSYLLRDGREEMWIKVEATVNVREGEEAEDAWYRLTDQVDERMEARINEIKAS